MEQPQTDMFNEPHITIKDNSVLEQAANRLLLMIQRNPDLLNGDSMAEIDRTIFAEILWEDGLQHLISADKKREFVHVITSTPDNEVYSRARRYLSEHDMIRLSSKAVQSAERMRARISGAMR